MKIIYIDQPNNAWVNPLTQICIRVSPNTEFDNHVSTRGEDKAHIVVQIAKKGVDRKKAKAAILHPPFFLSPPLSTLLSFVSILGIEGLAAKASLAVPTRKQSNPIQPAMDWLLRCSIFIQASNSLFKLSSL